MNKFDDRIPIYIQIVDLIKGDIVLKKLKEGSKLPSVRELSLKLKVNPNTIQRAYQELERQGITYTQRGMGTFVKEDKTMVIKLRKEMADEIIMPFIASMKNLGFKPDEIIQMVCKYTKEEGK